MLPLALLVIMTSTPASVRCDDTRRVAPGDVKKGLMGVRRDLEKRGLRVSDLPSDGVTAHRLLLAQMRTRAWCGAEEQLRVVQAALGRLPGRKDQPSKPPVTSFAATEELPEKEVAAGCPGLDKGRAPAAALAALASTLDAARVRPTEVRRGPELLEQLEQAIRLHDNPKTAKTSCVLAYRAGQVVDGLDRVIARFQRVNVLRDKRGVSDDEKPRFDGLVNDASRQMAVRDYEGARATLETLLLLMGDPALPSGNLPRL